MQNSKYLWLLRRKYAHAVVMKNCKLKVIKLILKKFFQNIIERDRIDSTRSTVSCDIRDQRMPIELDN